MATNLSAFLFCRLLLAVVCYCLTGNLYAQNQPNEKYADLQFGGTSATHFTPKIPDETEGPAKPRGLFIVVKNTDGTLYGNKCTEELAYKMGFQYLVQPMGLPGYRSELGRALHNFFTKFALTFRNGPFWQVRLRKKIEECRELTGDFVG